MTIIGQRNLKLWNGRWDFKPLNGQTVEHAYVGACTQTDAVELLKRAGCQMTLHELKVYWANCWGRSMDDVPRERGVWVEIKGEGLKRLI